VTTPPAPKCLCVSSIRLDAVLTAVSLSREFIRQTLRLWQLADQIDSADLVVSELVTNAIKSKAHHVIGVQLRLAGASLYVEVWDRGDGSPVIPEQTLDAEGGRGLFLVGSISKRWGIHRPAVGGKTVWSELPLTEPVHPPLLKDGRPLCDPGGHGPEAGPEWELVDIALVQRVVDGLRQLPDVELVR
jgi:anti-sigma regulatory factor (Ser/Thr protein kinase)